jgi:hypothetical protein
MALRYVLSPIAENYSKYTVNMGVLLCKSFEYHSRRLLLLLDDPGRVGCRVMLLNLV